MSATNRGPRLDPSGRDVYTTPRHAVDVLLPLLSERLGHRSRILEPCAGDGAIADVLASDYEVVCGDIAASKGSTRGSFCDATQVSSLRQFESIDAIVTNPPYIEVNRIAPALVEAFPLRPIWLLLRLNWLEPAKARADFLRRHTPSIAVLSKRPSFRGKGTDACAYAWFGFQSGPPTVRIL